MEHVKPEINWQFLNEGLDFYKSHNFTYTDVSWTVPEWITNITFTGENGWKTSKYGDLVGSAEQSFLHSALRGLKEGKYVTLSPCFREEDRNDIWHQTQFMKVELFQSTDVNENNLKKIIEICKSFFEKKIKQGLDVVTTDIGYDICYKGIELGSYGIRNFDNKIEWIYATGVAEPRLSTAIKFFAS